MVGYGRDRSRQQSTRQQSDRSAETSQGKEQHPAVGMSPIIRSTKEVRVICADCIELFVKAD